MASIRVRSRKDGTTTWAVLWRNPRTKTQTSMSFDSQREAENFRRILEAHNHDLSAAERTQDAIGRAAPTVEQAVAAHLEQLAGVTSRTLRDYQTRADLHITPHLGAIPVEALTRTHLTQWQRTLLEESGLSGRSVGEVHALLSAAVGTAVDAGWRGDNPVRGMRIPRDLEHEAAEPRFLSASEFDRLLGTVPLFWRPFVQFLAATGLRWGEAR